MSHRYREARSRLSTKCGQIFCGSSRIRIMQGPSMRSCGEAEQPRGDWRCGLRAGTGVAWWGVETSGSFMHGPSAPLCTSIEKTLGARSFESSSRRPNICDLELSVEGSSNSRASTLCLGHRTAITLLSSQRQQRNGSELPSQTGGPSDWGLEHWNSRLKRRRRLG